MEIVISRVKKKKYPCVLSPTAAAVFVMDLMVRHVRCPLSCFCGSRPVVHTICFRVEEKEKEKKIMNKKISGYENKLLKNENIPLAGPRANISSFC